jgi:hypothetical protein
VIRRGLGDDIQFVINGSFCTLSQVVSLTAMLALSALAVPVYEHHQDIEEQHYVSRYTDHNGFSVRCLKGSTCSICGVR